MTERYQSLKIEGNSSIVPVARKDEVYPITLSPFKDHGRPAFITSTIRTSRVLVDVASELTQEESQRLTNGAGRILEEILDGHQVKGTTVLSPIDKNKPNIYVMTFGDPFNPSGLRLYFHQGEHQGAPVLFQDARTRIKSSDRVTRVFRDSGYETPKGMEVKRKNR